MENWIDGLRRRAGPLADAATIFAASQGFDRDPPRGVEGLLGLSRAIEAQLDEDHDEEADRLFVETAGAYLAVLLLDHLQLGRHESREGKHRLRLGHGFFDPFAGIEHAFDAEDVGLALAAEVALAEAEANGRGPLARVIAELARQLELEGLAIDDHFDTRLWLSRDQDKLQLDVRRLVEATRDASTGSVRSAVRSLLDAVPRRPGASESTWSDAEDRILPRLLGERFGTDDGIYTVEVQATLRLAFVLHYEGRARFVTRREIDRWGVAAAHVRVRALNNLAQRSEHARFLRADTERGALVMARTGDGLDATRLVLPGLHDVLASELGSPFVAAVPHRDVLYACRLGDAGMLSSLRKRVEGEAADAPHAISGSLFLVHPDGRLS